MNAVVLAGGRNLRLRPITETRPKSLVNVLNKPVIERIIESLPKEVEHIYITCDYLAEELEKFFKGGGKTDMKITLVKEEKRLGTAGSIKVLEPELNGTFIVLQSDVISSVDIDKMLAYHKEKGAAVTVSVFRTKTPYEYGIVGMNDDGRIMKFLEKPKPDQVFSTLVNAGTYICEPVIFEQIPHYGYCDFSNDVFPRLLRNGTPVYGQEFKGFWMDIGTVDKYLAANRQLLNRSMEFEVGSRASKGARLVPPLAIGKGCKIGSSTIGPNVCIADKVEIGNNCKIQDSVIYRNTKIGAQSLVSHSIVCEKCTIGANAVVEEAVLGDKVKVSPKVKVDRGVRVWPGVAVKKDVPEGTYLGAPEAFW